MTLPSNDTEMYERLPRDTGGLRRLLVEMIHEINELKDRLSPAEKQVAAAAPTHCADPLPHDPHGITSIGFPPYYYCEGRTAPAPPQPQPVRRSKAEYDQAVIEAAERWERTWGAGGQVPQSTGHALVVAVRERRKAMTGQ